VTGALVPQTNLAAGLADAIIRLLTDHDLAARMGKAGREWARVQTWDRAAEQMIALYNHAVQIRS
ncbi:MAG: glycosyltransferase family 4 protein, partial [Anaerolineae bacterium]|nr:glycosyltransferase family 4 protein [Anaerolineae bacterium]